MSFETELDTAFTILLGKAQGTVTQTVPSTPAPTPVTSDVTSYTVVFPWSGGGLAIVASACDPLVVEVPDAGEIVWCHVYAYSFTGTPVSVTAALSLAKTTYGDGLGSTTSVSGSGSAPGLSAASQASPSMSGWNTHLDAGDTIIGRLTSFSGTARGVAMVLKVRRDSAT